MRDIVTGYKNSVNYEHFLGTFVFEDVLNDEKEIIGRNIIDGQQRMTTLQIVVFALIFTLRSFIVTHWESASSQDISDAIKRIEMLKTYVSYMDRKTLKPKSRLDNGIDNFNKLEYLTLLEVADYKQFDINLYNKPSKDSIVRSFWFIVKYINDVVINPNEFLMSIIDFQSAFFKMNIITVSSSNENEVLNLFEVLNARGLYLKQTELLKNFLFRQLKENPIRDEIKIEWEKMNTRFFDVKLDSDDFLLHFMRAYYSIKDLKKEFIYQNLKEQELIHNFTKVKQLYDNIIKHYESYVDISLNIGSSDIEKNVFEYFLIKKNRQVRPILLSLRTKKNDGIISEDKYNFYINQILNFFIGFNIAQKRSNTIEHLVASYSFDIFWSKTFADVNKSVLAFFTKINEHYPDLDYILSRIEDLRYSNKNKRGNVNANLLVYYFKHFYNSVKIDQDIVIPFHKMNIEHVLLDKIDDPKTWELGNLLVVTERYNSELLKDRPYSEKREILLTSEIRYNLLFAQKYQTFNHQDITERSVELCKNITDHFKFQIDEIQTENSLESKLPIVRKLLLDLLPGDAQASDKLDSCGVLKFFDFIERNPRFSIEIKDKFLALK